MPKFWRLAFGQPNAKILLMNAKCENFGIHAKSEKQFGSQESECELFAERANATYFIKNNYKTEKSGIEVLSSGWRMDCLLRGDPWS